MCVTNYVVSVMSEYCHYTAFKEIARIPAAILKNGRQSRHGKNLRWPYIQIFF